MDSARCRPPATGKKYRSSRHSSYLIRGASIGASIARRPLLQGGQKYRHELELPIFKRSPHGTSGPHSAQHLRIPLGTRATTGVGGGGTTGAEAAWVVAGEVPDASVTGGTTGTSSPTVEVAMARVVLCEQQVRIEVRGSSFLELVASCARKKYRVHPV